MQEIWKGIVGYEDSYQVSNLGNIRSLDNVRVYADMRVYHYKGKVMKTSVDTRGYICFHVYRDTIRKTCSGHRVVAEAFLPNPENKKTVNHKDGRRTNNHVDNLEWATYSENNIHAIEILGKICPKKFDCKISKLSRQAVIDILLNCESRVEGKMLKDFATKYKVSSPCIRNCLNNFNISEFTEQEIQNVRA